MDKVVRVHAVGASAGGAVDSVPVRVACGITPNTVVVLAVVRDLVGVRMDAGVLVVAVAPAGADGRMSVAIGVDAINAIAVAVDLGGVHGVAVGRKHVGVFGGAVHVIARSVPVEVVEAVWLKTTAAQQH